LTEPGHPQLQGSYLPMTMQVRAVDCQGDRTYLLSGIGLMSELEVLDTSNPLAPVRLGGVPLQTDVFDLRVAPGGLALVAAGAAGVRVFDVSSAGNPIPRPGYDAVTGVYALELRPDEGRLAVVLPSENGLAIVDFSDIAQPVLVGRWEQVGANLTSVAVAGAKVFVGNRTNLWAIDVTDPSSPSMLAEYPLAAADLEAVGDRVCALTSDGLVILGLDGSGAQPRLEYLREGGAWILDWSAAGAGAWVLEQTADLLDAQGWQILSGTEMTTQWPLDTNESLRFFRLAPIAP
jgi:hypothetical protein